MDNITTNWAKTTLANLSKMPQNEVFAGAISIILDAYTAAIQQNQAYEHTIKAQEETIKQLNDKYNTEHELVRIILGSKG